MNSNILQLLLQPREKEQIVIQILEDHIIYTRTAEPLYDAVNALRKGHDIDYEPELKYNGYTTCFKVMGINDNDELCDELSDILYKAFNENPKQAYDELAKDVFAAWMDFLKSYSLSNLKPVA